MKRLCLLFALVWGLFLAGCVSSPLVNTFMDPDIPTSAHAVLSVDNNLNIAMIDGQMTLKSSGSGNDGSIKSKEPLVLLTPGFHTIEVQYLRQSSNYTYYNNTTTISTEQTGFIKVENDFVGGHYYRIFPDLDGNNVYFRFVDETDPSVWNQVLTSPTSSSGKKVIALAEKRVTNAQKKVPKAKYPKNISTLLAFQKGETAPFTPLEGTWLVPDTPDSQKLGMSNMTYTFKGNSFTINFTKTFTDKEFKQQNTFRKMMDMPPLTEKVVYPVQRGIINVANNTVTMTWLQQSLDGFAFVSLPKMAQPKMTNEFTITPDGEQVTFTNKGKNPSTMTKQ